MLRNAIVLSSCLSSIALAQPTPAPPPVAGPAATAAAQSTALPDADPAMWVVKDADTTVYLFGTFHLLDGKRAWFNDEVKTAFDASDELVLEAVAPEDPATLQPLIIKYAVDPAGKTLSSKLSAELNGEVNATLAEYGVPAAAMQPLEPWFVALTVTTLAAQKLGLTPEHGPEKILTTAAKSAGKSVGELEGMEWQLQLFDGFTEAQQVEMLDQTIEQVEKIDEQLTPMLTAWTDGDTEGLAKILNAQTAEDPALYKLIFSDRNAKWAEWIDARMDKPGTVFMAVGAGHLGGRDSVQDYLAKKGIKAERVTD